MQVFWTIFAGVCVYVLGQIVVKFVIDPIQDFYKLAGEIGHSLILYANVYSNTRLCDDATLREAHDTFRKQSCELFAKMHMIPLYSLWSRLNLLPSLANVREAGGNLIGISNGSLDKSDSAYKSNEKRRRAIEQFLDLKTGD